MIPIPPNVVSFVGARSIPYADIPRVASLLEAKYRTLYAQAAASAPYMRATYQSQANACLAASRALRAYKIPTRVPQASTRGPSASTVWAPTKYPAAYTPPAPPTDAISEAAAAGAAGTTTLTPEAAATVATPAVEPWYKNPLVIVAGLAALAGGAYVFTKRKAA